MSKKTKSESKQKRLIKKRSLKVANKAKYLSWKQAGENSKSYRARKTAQKNNKKLKGLHTAFYYCGNPACTTCFNHVIELGILPKRNKFRIN